MKSVKQEEQTKQFVNDQTSGDDGMKKAVSQWSRVSG